MFEATRVLGSLVAGAAEHRCEDECASHRCAGVGALGPLVVPQWFDASHCYVASSKNGGYCKHLNYPHLLLLMENYPSIIFIMIIMIIANGC